MRVKIGDGKSTSLWWDPWSRVGPLGMHEDRVHLTHAGYNTKESVAEAIENLNTLFPVPNIPACLRLLELDWPNLNDEKDRMIWYDEKEFEWSTKRVWESIRKKGDRPNWYKLVWKAPIIPKCSFIAWVAVKGRLATMDWIQKRGTHLANKCVLCNIECETIDHLFFNCNFTLGVWKNLIGNNFGWTNFVTFDEWVQWATSLWNKKEYIKWRLLFNSTIYILWRERNSRIHKHKTMSAITIFYLICSMVECLA